VIHRIEPGTCLGGRYEVVREIGHGGMSTVYLADDAQLARHVAVKVLSPDLAAVVGRERFLREITIASRLSHPHIVPLLDSGVHDEAGAPSLLYYIMGYVEGESLRDKLLRERQLPVDDALQVTREVALALGHAHAQGVVHRDIKPENILLTGRSAVIADFGIAKLVAADPQASKPVSQLTGSGISIGTVAYMSPEQALAEPDLDGRSDQYSLASVLYEMLVGEPPFTGPTVQAIIAKRLTDPVPSARRLRETISPALDDVIIRALQRAPVDRYASILDFADALDTARRVPTPVSGIPEPSSFTATTRPARIVRTRRMVTAIAITFAVVLSAAAGVRILRGRNATAAGAAVLRSLAILPFEDLSAAHNEEYFSAGMTDELITALSHIDGLRVAARASSRAVKSRGDDPRAIGQALGVDALLDGSVRRAGDSLRISVQLVNTNDGSTRWSQSYDGSVSDVFAVQERIAQAVARALQVELATSRQLVARPTADLESYQWYLKGRLALQQRSNESLHEATRYFQQVVDRDPKSARAWTGLADAWAVLALNYWGPPSDYYARSKAAAERAVELDSTLAEAQTSYAIVSSLYDRNWTEAERAFRRAIAIDPNYSLAHYFYSILLSGRLRFDESVAEATKAIQLDPLSPPLSQGPGMSYVLGGRPADAVPSLQAATRDFPEYYFPYCWLGVALARSGHAAEGIAAARKAVAMAPGNVLVDTFLGMTLAAAGKVDEARRVAASIEARDGRDDPLPYTYLARIYAGIDDHERAFFWLRRAVRAREGQVATMLTAGFENIRHDPRFDEIARQAGVK